MVDVSSQAKNLLGGDGAGKPSVTALCAEALQRELPNARVIYSSATGGLRMVWLERLAGQEQIMRATCHGG